MKSVVKMPRFETRAMPESEPELIEKRNNLITEMEKLIDSAKTEKRNLKNDESARFNSIKKEVNSIDEKLKAFGVNTEMRMAKNAGRTNSPLEVRGYQKNERIGSHSLDVTVGDLIYSHITGRFRNQEVRQALSTTSGGLSIPTEVYKDFIDRLRNQSFLGETTLYPMNTQTLLIPRVTDDPTPHFKLENELAVEGEPAFTSVTLQAKPLYCLTSISLELIESSNLEIGEVISNIMIGAMQNSMQTHMMFGATNGYTGILNDLDINKITGTAPVDYTQIGAGIQAIRGNNGEPNAVIATSDTLMGLELATDTTGQFITPPQFYKDLNKYALNGTDLGGDVLVADLSAIAWGILSEGGLQIEIDKSGEAFQRGQIKIRARINGDFKLTNPKLVAHVDAP
jgi:HK97 family phage major capsid protein